MCGRLRCTLAMSLYRPILLVSIAALACEATPAASVGRIKRDISTDSAKWKQIEADVTELVNACAAYNSGKESVISAVKAFRDANSRLLNIVENASLSIRSLVDDAVFPSLVSL